LGANNINVEPLPLELKSIPKYVWCWKFCIGYSHI